MYLEYVSVQEGCPIVLHACPSSMLSCPSMTPQSRCMHASEATDKMNDGELMAQMYDDCIELLLQHPWFHHHIEPSQHLMNIIRCMSNEALQIIARTLAPAWDKRKNACLSAEHSWRVCCACLFRWPNRNLGLRLEGNLGKRGFCFACCVLSEDLMHAVAYMQRTHAHSMSSYIRPLFQVSFMSTIEEFLQGEHFFLPSDREPWWSQSCMQHA